MWPSEIREGQDGKWGMRDGGSGVRGDEWKGKERVVAVEDHAPLQHLSKGETVITGEKVRG